MQIGRVGWIQAIFRSQAPIAVAQGHSNAGDRIGAKQFFRHVLMQRRRLSVADENPDQSLALIDRIGFYFCFADDRRIGSVGQRCDAHPVGDIESPAMITASDGIGAGEFASAGGKWDAAMGATVFQSKTLAVIPDEEQILSEDL